MCDHRIEAHDGFYVCVICGNIQRPYLCARDSTNNNELHRQLLYRQPYCRAHRLQRLLGRINGRGPTIPDHIIEFCLKYKPRTFKAVQALVRIYRRETGRKPIGFGQVPSLFRIVSGERLPIMTIEEIQFVKYIFCELEYHNRGKKRFAYNYILRRIFELPVVQRRFGRERSLKFRSLIKPLSCQVRCAEYYKNFNAIVQKNSVFTET